MNRKITIKLKSKPISISPEYRFEYKISMLVIILYFSCRNNKGSIKKINYIMNSLCTYRSMMNMEKITKAVDIHCDFDKTLNKVLNLAIIDDLVCIKEGQVVLLNNGMKLVQLIIDNRLFVDELCLLEKKKKNFITESILK
ncbi:hypothetical protein [Clostridium felsineum]|uniref:hypothetical protein n=1 Tax=Clostridium felsineum TaxID=36839 RepID=UPI00098C2C22|nr:hypothetical protein [Clostridium felsineum]URZ17194.1 hypothetical protein CLFE_032460 [Clostridium felsineum DSM 794]